MPLDNVPQSSQSDGRWKIAFVPSGSALSVAILNAVTTINVTYSFTPDGFAWDTTQATVEDKRLTLVQDLSRPGKVSETLNLKYVDSADVASAAALFPAGTEGKFVVRRGIDNAVAWTAAQKVDVISFIAGAQRPDAPTENGLDTISQQAFITAPTVRKGVLVA